MGGWMPERESGAVDPADRAVREEAIEHAVQLLIDRLTPAERAVYVLREAFDYPFREIAVVLGTSEVNARQLARRARKHLTEQRRVAVDPAQRAGLREAFLGAARDGDMARLVEQLTGGALTTGAVRVEAPGGWDQPRSA